MKLPDLSFMAASLLQQDGTSLITGWSYSLFLLLLVMSLAGVAGGYAGYLLGPPDPAELDARKRHWYLRRSLVLGVVASFMVPLFLSVVGKASGADKNLVDKLIGSDTTISFWLVFVGFCLVAAVSAQRFISALTKRILDDVLSKVRQVDAKVENALEEVADLGEDLEQVAVVSDIQPTSDEAQAVLQAAYLAKERRPSFSDIRTASGLEDEVVKTALAELQNRGLIKSKDYDGVEGWRVRTAGKALVGQLAGRASESTD
jgi:hypothetical protein